MCYYVSKLLIEKKLGSALVVELAYTRVLETRARNGLRVQLPPNAQNRTLAKANKGGNAFLAEWYTLQFQKLTPARD